MDDEEEYPPLPNYIEPNTPEEERELTVLRERREKSEKAQQAIERELSRSIVQKVLDKHWEELGLAGYPNYVTKYEEMMKILQLHYVGHPYKYPYKYLKFRKWLTECKCGERCIKTVITHGYGLSEEDSLEEVKRRLSVEYHFYLQEIFERNDTPEIRKAIYLSFTHIPFKNLPQKEIDDYEKWNSENEDGLYDTFQRDYVISPSGAYSEKNMNAFSRCKYDAYMQVIKERKRVKKKKKGLCMDLVNMIEDGKEDLGSGKYKDIMDLVKELYDGL